MSTYITERRLRHAFRRLTDPDQKIPRVSQLAFELGFAHASAFTRSFKVFYGLTPKEIRTLSVSPTGNDIPFIISPDAMPYIHTLSMEADETINYRSTATPTG